MAKIKSSYDDIYSGEYVRTISGKIARVNCVIGVHTLLYFNNKEEDTIIFTDNGKFKRYDIANHSKDLKDIIQVGDYINGTKLLLIEEACDYNHNNEKDGKHMYYSFEDSHYDVNEYVKELKIYSILTHEMVQKYAYEVKEKE